MVVRPSVEDLSIGFSNWQTNDWDGFMNVLEWPPRLSVALCKLKGAKLLLNRTCDAMPYQPLNHHRVQLANINTKLRQRQRTNKTLAKVNLAHLSQ